MLAPVLKGLLLGFLLAISVGPVIFAIIRHSISHGKLAGYMIVAGISASDILLLLVSHFFTQLFHSLMAHKTAIAIAGSIFLIVLGLYTLFFKKIAVSNENSLIDKEYKTHHYIGMFFSGFLINILNPAVFLFWFAWTAAIHADAESAPNPPQYQFIVFATCLLFVLLTDLMKVSMAVKLRNQLTPKVLRTINKISGIILIGFGISLIGGVLFWGSSSH